MWDYDEYCKTQNRSCRGLPVGSPFDTKIEQCPEIFAFEQHHQLAECGECKFRDNCKTRWFGKFDAGVVHVCDEYEYESRVIDKDSGIR
jgi:hypothetical protein